MQWAEMFEFSGSFGDCSFLSMKLLSQIDWKMAEETFGLIRTANTSFGLIEPNSFNLKLNLQLSVSLARKLCRLMGCWMSTVFWRDTWIDAWNLSCIQTRQVASQSQILLLHYISHLKPDDNISLEASHFPLVEVDFMAKKGWEHAISVELEDSPTPWLDLQD